MLARGKRRGRKPKGIDLGTEENIIEVHHPDEGMLLYRPSSSLMPARPLGAPLEVPIVAQVKKEIKVDEAEVEAESSNLSTLDAVAECAILKSSQMTDVSNIGAPSENESSMKMNDGNVLKIKIETEPLDDELDDFESSLVKHDVESSRVNEKIPTEHNQKSADPQEGTEDDSLEKNLCGQNSIALWDLEKMFPDATFKNIDQSIEDSNFDSQINFEHFQKTYLDFCLELNTTVVKECLGYLNSWFPNIKKHTLFCLELSSQKNIASKAVRSASKETVHAVKCDISSEALKKILEVSNTPSIPSDLIGQNSQLCTPQQLSYAPQQKNSESGFPGLIEMVDVKKEPVSPKKSEPCSHLVDSGEENASKKWNSVVSNIQTFSQPGSSKIVPEVSVTLKEALKARNESDDIDLDRTKVATEVPSQKINSTAVHSEEAVSAAKHGISNKALQKTLEVSNLPSISSDFPVQSNSLLLFPVQSNSIHQQIPKSEYSGLNETVTIKTEPVSPQKSEPCRNLVDAVEKNSCIKSISVVPCIQQVSLPVSSKTIPEVLVIAEEFPKKRKEPEVIDLEGITVVTKKEPISPEKVFGETSKKRKNSCDIDLNAVTKHIKKEVVPVENSVSSVEKTAPASCTLNIVDKSVISKVIEAVRAEETNKVVTPKQTVQEKKMYDNFDNSLSKSKNTKQNNTLDVSHISSLPATKDIPNSIRQIDSTTSVRHIPVKKFSDVHLNAIKEHIEKDVVVCGESFSGIGVVGKDPAIKKHLDLSSFVTNTGRQIFSDPECSPSKSNTTEQDNRMDVSFLPSVKDAPCVIRQSDSAPPVTRIRFKFLTPGKAKTPAMAQSPNNPLQESACDEGPQKKRKLTTQEYLQRKSSSSSSNSNSISKCASLQTSFTNPLEQISRIDNSSESLTSDPRIQKCVLSNPSILGLPSSHNIPPYEIGQNVYTCKPNLSLMSIKSSVPIAREKPSPEKFIEPLKAHQISQCSTRSQTFFEPRRGNNSSVMKQLREKIGRRFIAPSDVIGVILEWNVSWLEQQKETLIVPPIIHEAFSYTKVTNEYGSLESYYNTYLPLHLLNIWMSMYKSWEKQEFLPDSFFDCREEKSTYVKICCSIRLNEANKTKLPKKEDILICQVDGHPKKLFGKVVNVNVLNMQSSMFGDLGDIIAYIDIICAENFDANPRRPIKLQKLNNIRIALNICQALEYTNSFMRSEILNPKDQRSKIKIFCAQPFINAADIQSNVQQIMISARSRSHSITLVRTVKPSDSLTAITCIVPEVVRSGGLIFLCMKEEAAFFEMASDMAKYNPVLAVKEEDVPALPHELSIFTIKNLNLKDLEQCHVVLTLMSAMYVGELETRLQKDSVEEGKNAMCLIHEAQYFLETETALLLEHNFKSLILLGREGLIDDVEAMLKRQSFDKSLFSRIFESNIL